MEFLDKFLAMYNCRIIYCDRILKNVFTFLDLSEFYNIPQTACDSIISENSTLRLPVDSITNEYANNMVSF